MEKRYDYPCRLFGTAISFALFGIVGLLLGGIAFPLARLIPAIPERRKFMARQVVFWCFRRFIYFMQAVGVLTYSFTGIERLGRPGQLILANHPSLIDVVFLIGFTPQVGCVVKSALFRNPFTSGVVSMAGYLPNESTVDMVEKTAEALRSGDGVIMFPEGTRSRTGEPLVFERGAASVAVRAAACVTPVFITVDPPTLRKNEPWYRIPARRPHFSLVVGEDVDVLMYRHSRSIPVASRVFNKWLVDHFDDRLYGRAAAAGSATAAERG